MVQWKYPWRSGPTFKTEKRNRRGWFSSSWKASMVSLLAHRAPYPEGNCGSLRAPSTSSFLENFLPTSSTIRQSIFDHIDYHFSHRGLPSDHPRCGKNDLFDYVGPHFDRQPLTHKVIRTNAFALNLSAFGPKRRAIIVDIRRLPRLWRS